MLIFTNFLLITVQGIRLHSNGVYNHEFLRDFYQTN